MNPIQQYYAIKEARTKADYVLAIVYGGHEYYQLPSLRMQETYRFFVDAGADAVVNHHHHCYSGFEIYNGKPIFYGLGNFLFDYRGHHKPSTWHEGILAEIDFSFSSIKYDYHPYRQCAKEIIVELLKKEDFDKSIQELNIIIANREELSKKEKEYYYKSMDDACMTFCPNSNRYIRAFRFRHYLPIYSLRKGQLLRIYNYLFCESHFDKIRYYLQYQYNKL